jgi:hypothetical protein
MSESTSRDARSRVVRRILAIVVLLEAVLCVGYGLFLAVETLTAAPADRLASAVMAVTAVVVGAALLLAVRAARRGRRAARAPILVWQLMQLAVARLTVGTNWAPFGVALAILSVGAVVALFWPGALDEDVRAS